MKRLKRIICLSLAIAIVMSGFIAFAESRRINPRHVKKPLNRMTENTVMLYDFTNCEPGMAPVGFGSNANVTTGMYDVADGYVKVTSGNVIDYDFVKADILRTIEAYNLRSAAYDRWNSSQTIIDLQNEGMECNPFGQGYGSMSAPTKEFEKLVLTERIEHFGNPVLRWMLSSTVVMTDPAGNIKPDKAKSAQKIDGIVASIMALGEWMTAQADEDNNPYNQRGMLSL